MLGRRLSFKGRATGKSESIDKRKGFELAFCTSNNSPV